LKIYTKTGDTGETSLFDNTRVSKADARVDAYGAVDELNACLGTARAAGVDGEIGAIVESLQKDLFALGARLADPSTRIAARVEKVSIGSDAVERIELTIDRLEATLPPLRQFVLPGGSRAAAALRAGATLHEHSPLEAIGPGAPTRLRVAGRTIEAGRVVLAVNAFLPTFLPRAGIRPALTLALGLPLTIAVGTSLFIMTLTSGAALTAPTACAPPMPAVLWPGRNGTRSATTATGPTPGPPPPCGMQNVLCRFRWQTSAPMNPGEVRPTCAFMFAPSM